MIRRSLRIVALLTFSACARPAAAPGSLQDPLVEAVALRSRDGVVTLRGEVDFPPERGSRRHPLVLMVPGTGPFDRDVHFSTDMFGASPPASRGLVFKQLSNAFNGAGFATLRFDKRGFHCSRATMPAPPPGAAVKEISAHYLRACADPKESLSTTPTSMREDIAQLYAFAASHPRVDPERIVVFAHSEGSLHVARLVEGGAIAPKGILLMGGLAESPRSMIHWQMVDRTLSLLERADRDHDGVWQKDEVAALLESEGGRGLEAALAKLLPGDGPWTKSDVVERLERQYDEERAAALALPDGAPYGKLASSAWWKQWFADERPVMESLLRYPGPIVIENGEDDLQTPAGREFAWVEANRSRFASFPKLVRHPNRGHTLGRHPIYGPMDEDAERELVAELVRLAGGSVSVPPSRSARYGTPGLLASP